MDSDGDIEEIFQKLIRASDSRYDKEDGCNPKRIFLKEKNNVSHYTQHGKAKKGERALKVVRGSALIRCHPEAYREMVLSLSVQRKRWDIFFNKGKVVEKRDDDHSIVWFYFQTTKCALDIRRDLVLYRAIRRQEDGSIVIAFQSIPSQQELVSIPEKCVRATAHASGYVIKPLDDGSGKCKVTYLAKVDLGGVPAFVLNLLNEEQPQILARQRRFYVEMYGNSLDGDSTFRDSKMLQDTEKAEPCSDPQDLGSISQAMELSDTDTGHDSTSSMMESSGVFPDTESLDVLVKTNAACERIKGNAVIGGLRDMVKLTARSVNEESAETAGLTWISEGAADVTKSFLEQLDPDQKYDVELLESHLSLLENVARFPKVIVEFSGLVEVLCKIMIEWDGSDFVLSSVLKIVGLLCVDEKVRAQFLKLDIMGILIAGPSVTNDRFLSSLLPKLLKDDEKMGHAFLDEGGQSFLKEILTVFEGSPTHVAGCVAVMELLTGIVSLNARVVEDEELVNNICALLKDENLGNKIKLHIVRTIYNISKDPLGQKTVEDAGAVLYLMELLEHDDTEQLSLAVASFELMALLCNTRTSLDQIDEFGGLEFIEYILCFLESQDERLLNPLCGLLHILSHGMYHDLIIQGMKEQRKKNPKQLILKMTLDLILNTKSKEEKLEYRSEDSVMELEEVITKPQRKHTSLDAVRARNFAKRANVIKEIVKSERVYSVSLFTLIHCYKDRMQSETSSVTAKEISMLFGNVDEVYAIHKELIKKLDKKAKGTIEDPNLGLLFCEAGEEMMAPYREYHAGFSQAQQLLEVKLKSKKFRDLLHRLGKEVVSAGLSLENYLTLPTQRIGRYIMLIGQLNKVTPLEHSDKQNLDAAEMKFQSMAVELEEELSKGARHNLSQSQLLFSQSSGGVDKEKARMTRGTPSNSPGIFRKTKSTGNARSSLRASAIGSSSPNIRLLKKKNSGALKRGSQREFAASVNLEDERANDDKEENEGRDREGSGFFVPAAMLEKLKNSDGLSLTKHRSSHIVKLESPQVGSIIDLEDDDVTPVSRNIDSLTLSPRKASSSSSSLVREDSEIKTSGTKSVLDRGLKVRPVADASGDLDSLNLSPRKGVKSSLSSSKSSTRRVPRIPSPRRGAVEDDKQLFSASVVSLSGVDSKQAEASKSAIESTAKRVAATYNSSERLKISTNKNPENKSKYTFVVQNTKTGDILGYGKTAGGLFLFFDLEGKEIGSRIPVSEIMGHAKSPRVSPRTNEDTK